MELYPNQSWIFYVFHALDQKSISAWCQKKTWSCQSLCSWWYVNFLENLVQDVLSSSWSRTKKYPDHRIDFDLFHIIVLWTIKLLSYVWVDFFKVTDFNREYCHNKVRQSCTNGILCRLSNRCSCAGARIYIGLSHWRTRCCDLVRISNYGLSHFSEIQTWSLCYKYHRTMRCTRTQRSN